MVSSISVKRNRTTSTSRRLEFDLPTFSKSRSDPLSGVFVVRELHPGVVPQELALVLVVRSRRAKDDPCRERPGNAEVGATRSTALAGADPVACMRGNVPTDGTGAGAWAGRARKVGVRELVVRPARARKQPDVFTASI